MRLYVLSERDDTWDPNPMTMGIWLRPSILLGLRGVWILILYGHMAVSENRGTPKSSILKSFSIINHPFWGATIFGNTHIVFQMRAWGSWLWRVSVFFKVNSGRLMPGKLFCWDWRGTNGYLEKSWIWFFRVGFGEEISGRFWITEGLQQNMPLAPKSFI